MFIAKNIKSEESFIHKESNQSTKYKKDSIFSEGTVPPIISNTQNTTCTSSISNLGGSLMKILLHILNI